MILAALAGAGALLAAADKARIEELDNVEHRVCAGCGSSRSDAALKADGYISCCPERQLLTAKEWAARAEATEAENVRLREALTEIADPYGPLAGSVLAKANLARAALNQGGVG